MKKKLFIYFLIIIIILILLLLLFFIPKKPKEIIKEKKIIELPEKEKKIIEKKVKERTIREKIITSEEKFEVKDYNIYMLKINPLGELIWQKTIDNKFIDWAEFGFQTLENDIVLLCRSYDIENFQDRFYIIKTDEHGNLLSQIQLEDFNDPEQKTKEGYITIGKMWTGERDNYEAYISSTDNSGIYLWLKNFSSRYYEWGYFVLMVKDSTYLIGEDIDYDGSSFDFYLRKKDMSGSEKWTKSYGEKGLNKCYSITTGLDDGYILVGTSYLFDKGKSVAYLLKVDEDGNKLWDRVYEGKGNNEVFSVAACGNSGYLFAGATNLKRTGNYDVYLLKTDIDGNKLWENTYGNGGNDAAYHIFNCNDGNFILVGVTQKK